MKRRLNLDTKDIEMENQIATPIDLKKLMAEAASKLVKEEKAPSSFISFKSGILTIEDQPIPGNKIKCIILASLHENAYFPRKYDPNTQVSPDCWALGTSEEMEPTDEVTHKESEDCASCPRNQWPEAKGQPKECKNIRRLALVDAKILASEDVLSHEVWYARLPVTSVKNWSQYAIQIGNVVSRPPWGVITELSVVPDLKTQFKVHFQFQGLVPDERLEILCKLAESEHNKGLWFPYPKNVAVAPPPVQPPKSAKY